MTTTMFPRTRDLGIPYRSTGAALVLTLRDEHDEVVAHEIFDQNVYRLGREVLDGACVLDVGACFGGFTLFCILNGAKRVVAVEPHPGNLDALERNVAAVDAGKVIVRPVAAGLGGRSVQVFGQSVHAWTEPYPSGTVEKSLRDLLDDVGPGDVDVVKVDCEGAEYDLLLGASHEDIGRMRALVIEWHGPAEHPRLVPRLGELCEHLMTTHTISAFGRPSNGGYLFAARL